MNHFRHSAVHFSMPSENRDKEKPVRAPERRTPSTQASSPADIRRERPPARTQSVATPTGKASKAGEMQA